MEINKFNIFFSSVEEGSLRLNLSLSNDLRTFIFNLKVSEEYYFAKELLKSDFDNYSEKLTTRIDNLITKETDEKYLHKYDIAIASYLYLISEMRFDLVNSISNLVLEMNLKNIWWTAQMIDYLNSKFDDTNTETKTVKIEEIPLSTNFENLKSISKSTTTLSI